MGVTSDNESVGDTDFKCKVGETFLMFLKLHPVSWNVGFSHHVLPLLIGFAGSWGLKRDFGGL